MNDKDTDGQDWRGEPREKEGGASGAAQLQLVPTEPQPMPFEFRGNAREYFKIWVVNLALTLVTLGIYSAWAKVRKLRYFYGNTYLDGSSFEFLGRPLAILKGRIVAVLAFAAYWLSANFYPLANLALLPVFALCFPWVMVKALNFRARNSAFRNLTFSYHGTYGQVAAAYMGLPVLIGGAVLGMSYLTGGLPAMPGNTPQQLSPETAAKVGALFGLVMLGVSLLFPYFFYLQKRAFLAPRRFGDTAFTFDTGPRAFYKLVFRLSLASLGAVIMVGVLTGVLGGFPKGAPHSVPTGLAVMPIVIGLLMVLAQYLIYITFMTWTRNLMLSAVRIGEAQLSSRLEVRKVFWLYVTNILAVVCTLGMLAPWAKVRLMRYQTSRTSLLAPHGTENFTGHPGQSASAVGEGLADIFDLDIAV